MSRRPRHSAEEDYIRRKPLSKEDVQRVLHQDRRGTTVELKDGRTKCLSRRQLRRLQNQ